MILKLFEERSRWNCTQNLIDCMPKLLFIYHNLLLPVISLFSRWNCTQNLTDCISKLGKLGSTSNYYTHTYDVANACFQSWRYKHADNHGKDMRALEHDHSISNRFSEWRRQLMQACGMPFTSDACRCDL